MFVVLLKFGAHKARAAALMAAHNAWIQRGFDEGVFLLAGSLHGQAGGALLATGTTLEALQHRVAEDPFVAEGVVQPEVHAITPGRVTPGLQALLGEHHG